MGLPENAEQSEGIKTLSRVEPRPLALYVAKRRQGSACAGLSKPSAELVRRIFLGVLDQFVP